MLLLYLMDDMTLARTSHLRNSMAGLAFGPRAGTPQAIRTLKLPKLLGRCRNDTSTSLNQDVWTSSHCGLGWPSNCFSA